MDINISKINRLKNKKNGGSYKLDSRKNYFDSGKITVLDNFLIDDGILVFYCVKNPFCLGGAVFDKNSNELIYRTANPILQSKVPLENLKLTVENGNLELTFSKKGEIYKEVFSIDYILGKDRNKNKDKPFKIQRCLIEKSNANPIMRPVSEHKWESCGVFNPAVLNIDGVIYLLYRAVGDDGGSMIGCAITRDGIHIDERLSNPIYRPRESFELRISNVSQPLFVYSSGPRYDSWGGCEDPRAVRIGGTIYMTYTAFNGINPPCVAITSINVSDFLEKKWDNWKKPVLLSPKDKMNKNWVIFPEKIHGKYAVLHSITPNVQIAYLDTLEFEQNPNINSVYAQIKNEDSWDYIIRGAGPIPLRIDEGWLVFYHAISKTETSKYKIGAMILDYDDPTKILYKSSFPIIEPDKNYENEGYKGGIVYTCGATIKGEDIILYYGGADTVICAASCNLKKFIQQIKDGNGKI